MKIGDEVIVKALVEPVYVDNNRTLIRKELDPPKKMIYTGYTYRQEGTYMGGKGIYGRFGFYDDYEPPYLSVEKTIKVLRVKESERSNDKFAFVEDVERIDYLLDFFGGSYQYGHRKYKRDAQ